MVFEAKVLYSRIKPEYLGKEVRIVYGGVIPDRNYSYEFRFSTAVRMKGIRMQSEPVLKIRFNLNLCAKCSRR